MRLSSTVFGSLLGLSAILAGSMLAITPRADADSRDRDRVAPYVNNAYISNTPGSVPGPTCRRPVPLMPVGGTDPEVAKRVSPPGFLITRSNWHTDFIVRSDRTFSSFLVRVFFKDAGTYAVETHLKYGDGTADQFYDDRVSSAADELLQIPGYPRRQPGRQIQPYQVHVKVGNAGAVGNLYVVSVYGCS